MMNKIAVVAGGTSGIGTEICRHLFTHGARVIATYNYHGDHESAKIWQKEQRLQGYDIDIKYTDIKSLESCANLVNEVEHEYESLDILINNADITHDVMNVTHHAIQGMIKRFYGRIINISSITGSRNLSEPAKPDIHTFTKNLALEVAAKGITVNTISPGYIETTHTETSVPDKIREKIISQIPVGRFGRPEEIARAVGFLAAQASSYITGVNLMVNGGHSLVAQLVSA